MQDLYPTLILIDMQRGFEEKAHWGGERNNPMMEKNALALLNAWRTVHAPIVIVQHMSTNPRSPLARHNRGFAFIDGFEPRAREKHIIKQQNSAFIGTDLKRWLNANAIKKLLIAGISTEHCVSTTTRMAANFGFQVRLVADACFAWAKKTPLSNDIINADTVHTVELAVLANEFAEIVTTHDMITYFKQ